MRRAMIFVTLAFASLSSADTAPSTEFEFKSNAVCSGRETRRGDKLTLKRGRDGVVQARILFNSYCLVEQYAPDVKYSSDEVQLRVERGCEEIAVDLACKVELSFRLNKVIARGTPIVFGFDSSEHHLRAVAP